MTRLTPRFALVMTLAATATLFTGHELATREAFDASLATVGDISENAMPAIVDLAEARAAVSELRTDIVHSSGATAAERRHLQDDVEARLATVDARIRAYQSLPPFEHERRLWPELDACAASLKKIAREVAAQAAPPPEEMAAFRAAATALDRIEGALVEINAGAASRAAGTIVATHERATAHSLDFLVAVIASVVALGVFAERWIARSEREKQRLIDELDSFSSRVAHDLRGPLSPISLALGLVRADPSLSERASHAALIAENSLKRALALIEGLLAFARSGARPLPGARCEVARVLADLSSALKGVAAQEHAEVLLEAPDGLSVAASDVALASILSNLARNGLLYLGESEKRSVAIRARQEGPSVAIEVADAGPGIPKDVLARLFRPFERGSTRPGGNGLGLSIVKRLVDAHGGSIRVRSVIGVGTVFEVRLPAA